MIDKQQILDGDLQKLNTVIHTHFVTTEEDAERQGSDAQRKQIAAIIFPLSASSLASQLQWDDAVADLIIKRCLKPHPDLPATLLAELKFSVQVLGSIAKFSHLDKTLTQALLALRIPILACSIVHTDFWLKNHPLKGCVDLLYKSAIGWQDGFNKHSDTFKSLFNAIISKLVAISPNDTGAYQQQLLSNQTELSQFSARFKMLSQRLIESETGALKAKNAGVLINRTINDLLTDVQLPITISSVIQSDIANELTLLLVREGPESSHWLRWQKLLKTLVTCYQPAAASGTDSRLKPLLSRLPDEIRGAYEALLPGDSRLKAFCDQLSFDFAVIAAGQPAGPLEPVIIQSQFNLLDDVDAQVSSTLINQVSRYQEEQWFLIKDEQGQVRRAQLALKLIDFNQLLFTNFVGQKVFTKDIGEFAYLLTANVVRPLYQESLLQRVFVTFLDKLLQDFAVLQQEKGREREAKQLQQQQQAAAKKLQQQQEAEAEARQQAALKARAEAEAFATRKKAEEARQNAEKIAGDLRRQARLSFDSLSLGSWIEVFDETKGDYFRAKLAVKFNATGRFVFVDQDGVTVIENQRDQLVDMVMQEKIRLLLTDETFAERLNKVVKTIRGDSE